jgi:hypothetical protein
MVDQNTRIIMGYVVFYLMMLRLPLLPRQCLQEKRARREKWATRARRRRPEERPVL